jgi:hypothetical protein
MEEFSQPELTKQSRPPSNNIRFIISGILLVISLAMLGVLYYNLRLAAAPLSDQTGVRGLVAVEHLTKPYSVVHFYRLSDAKEQTVTGTFRYQFTAPDEVIVFGYNKETPREQMAFIMDDQKIRLKKLAGLPGPIATIIESPSKAYLLLEGTSNSTKRLYQCVLLRTTDDFSSCRTIDDIMKDEPTSSTTLRGVFWNANKNSELIIRQKDDDILKTWSYLPGSKERYTTTTTPELAPIKRNADLFYTIKRYGPIVLTQEKNNKKKHTFLLSPSKKLLELANGQLLALDGQKSYLINPEKRTYSEFVPLPPTQERAVTVF